MLSWWWNCWSVKRPLPLSKAVLTRRNTAGCLARATRTARISSAPSLPSTISASLCTKQSRTKHLRTPWLWKYDECQMNIEWEKLRDMALPGIHCAHSIPACILGHPGKGRWTASAIRAGRSLALYIRTHRNPAIDPRNRVKLNKATYWIRLMQLNIVY